MAKSTSIKLGDHFDHFISAQVSQGRYGSASEVIRHGLRLLEEREQRIDALRRAISEGEQSGDAGVLDLETVRQNAKRKAGLTSPDA